MPSIDFNEEWTTKIRYQVLIGLVLCVIIIIVYFIITAFVRFIAKTTGHPGRTAIEPHTRYAYKSEVYSTNPNEDDAKVIKRSMNERSGLEFTYAMWLYIENEAWNTSRTEDMHVMHKGNKDGYPNRAPGIYIDRNTNALTIKMNTFHDTEIEDSVTIENIPVDKWFHLAVVVTQPKNLDIYINGFLKQRKILNGIPKQNYGNIYLTQDGGFSGMQSRIYYYDFAISAVSMHQLVVEGPSRKMSNSTRGSEPPYLAQSWWLEN